MQKSATTKKCCAGILMAGLLLYNTGCGRPNSANVAYEGLKAIEAGDFRRAAQKLQEATAYPHPPERAAALFNYLGIALAQSDQPEAALAAFEKAQQYNPTLWDAVYNAGVMYFFAEQFPQATDCFQRVAKNLPQETAALEFLALIHAQQNNFAEAQQQLDEAHRRRPDDPRILTRLGMLAAQAGRTEEAVAHLEKCLALDQHYAPAVYNLAVVCRRQKNPIQARSLYHTFTQMPGVPDFLLAAARQALAELNAELATAPVQPTAVDTNTIVTPPQPPTPTPPATPSAPPPTPDTLLQRAQQLEKQGRNEAAVNLYILAARNAQRAGHTTSRQRAIENAKRACGTDARANYHMGNFLLESGKHSDAHAFFLQAANLAPDWMEAQLALGRTAIMQNDFDTAIVALKTAIKINPDNPEAHWTLILVYDRQLHLAKPAQQLYQTFLERFPNDPRARTAKARLAALSEGKAHE